MQIDTNREINRVVLKDLLAICLKPGSGGEPDKVVADFKQFLEQARVKNIGPAATASLGVAILYCKARAMDFRSTRANQEYSVVLNRLAGLLEQQVYSYPVSSGGWQCLRYFFAGLRHRLTSGRDLSINYQPNSGDVAEQVVFRITSERPLTKAWKQGLRLVKEHDKEPFEFISPSRIVATYLALCRGGKPNN